MLCWALGPAPWLALGLVAAEVAAPVSVAAASRPCGEPARVTFDIGHTPRKPGAISARGKPEYLFNRRLVHELAAALRSTGGVEVAILNRAGRNISLDWRAAMIHALRRGILVSIHHNSVQPIYLRHWTYEGHADRFSNRYEGYSLFVSARPADFRESERLALSIGHRLREAGFKPSLHHAENIRGERRQLIDRRDGLYRFDRLAVLRRARIPAVLVEAGIIVNQHEELALEDARYRGRLVAAIARGIRLFCDLGHRETALRPGKRNDASLAP